MHRRNVSSQERGRSIVLYLTLGASLFLLTYTSCAPNKKDKGNQEPDIDPDKFRLEILGDKSTTKNHFVFVKITPGSSGMELKDFFVTASTEAGKGTVRGAGSKKGGKLQYTLALDDRNLEDIMLYRDGLGKDNKSFKQGKAVSFKIKCTPGPGTTANDTYTVTVSLVRKGSKPHTLTKSIELVAQQDIPETNEHKPGQFGLSLKDATNKNNYVRVKITPGSSGMELKDFFVTASIAGNEGTLRGHKGRKIQGSSSYNYEVDLTACSLADLFLEAPSKCLGKDDTRFEQGQPVSFKIRYTPAPGTKKDSTYTLAMSIECKGESPHTEKGSIVLRAQQDFPIPKPGKKS